MKIIISFLVFISQSINLFAQPVDEPTSINEKAYSQPFLHFVSDEKHFAKYAVEAHSGSFELMEQFKGKLHIPTGINRIWQDVENSNLHKKGEYDYSKDARVGIKLNFYVGGVLVSTALRTFEKPRRDDDSFTFYFDLDPLDFEQDGSTINFAFIEFLKKLEKKGSQLVIEAALASKDFNNKSYFPIASGSFYLRYDSIKYREWLKLATDYNIELKRWADSTMKSIFGETGFSKNFKMACLQNPCSKGYTYANTLESNNPCASAPQDSCKEAIVTYNFVKNDVPLTIKMLITLKENAEKVYIENNTYGSKEVSIEEQNLLSVSEMQKIITKKFPKDNVIIFADSRTLVYSHTRIQQPKDKTKGKLNRESGQKLIKETSAGKNWKRGFIYSAQSCDPKKPNRIFHFDAVSGKLLWITEVYEVTNEFDIH